MKKLSAFVFVLGLCTIAGRASALPACWMEDGVGGTCYSTKKLCEDASNRAEPSCSNRNASTTSGGTGGTAAGAKPAPVTAAGTAGGAASKAGKGRVAPRGAPGAANRAEWKCGSTVGKLCPKGESCVYPKSGGSYCEKDVAPHQ